MKKTLLAAALLAGFATAGVAQAETSVTLYGILDTGYGYQNFKYDHDGADFRARSSGLRDGTFNGSRWGLKGAEDLGDGLRAIFQVEASVNLGSSNTGNGGFARQSFVGLSSDNWGTFTMGRQYSVGVDSVAGVANGVNLGDMDKVFGATGLSEGTRVENSFKYVTPSFSGFQAGVLYGTGDDGSTTVIRNGDAALGERGSRVSAGLWYDNGPISAGGSYDRQSVTDFGGGEPDAMTAWQVNASYDFEIVKLSLAYGQDRNGKIGWNGNAGGYAGTGALAGFNLSNGYQDFKSNNYHVGLSAPLAGGKLYAGWNYSTSNLDDGDKWGDAADNLSVYQINYQYPLSKRTTVYAYGSYMKNVGYVADLNGTEAGIGLNHKF
jgi:predicted porin